MRGFSLIEIVIVLALIGTAAALSLPAFGPWQSRLFGEEDIALAAERLRTAQARAECGWNGKAHGVMFQDDLDKLVLYQGDSYLTRDSGMDQAIDLNPGSEFVFSRSGAPDINFGFRPSYGFDPLDIEFQENGRALGKISINQANVISWQLFSE